VDKVETLLDLKAYSTGKLGSFTLLPEDDVVPAIGELLGKNQLLA
jgi:hypothetical protein